jgi:ubiquitin-like-conjugating enzyme ATG3
MKPVCPCVSSRPKPSLLTASRLCASPLPPPARYLVLFLKFIASVVPTIQYDYTMSVGGE